jgi:hypothetical protein
MTEAARRHAPVRCPVCDRAVERQSRQQKYCSTRCRMKAFREKTPVPPGYTGNVTNPPKSSNENNVLQWQKTGSSLSINGPLNLLGGGSWRWPATGHLDGKTLSKIRHCEVGGELMLPPDGGAS